MPREAASYVSIYEKLPTEQFPGLEREQFNPSLTGTLELTQRILHKRPRVFALGRRDFDPNSPQNVRRIQLPDSHRAHVERIGIFTPDPKNPVTYEFLLVKGTGITWHTIDELIKGATETETAVLRKQLEALAQNPGQFADWGYKEAFFANNDARATELFANSGGRSSRYVAIMRYVPNLLFKALEFLEKERLFPYPARSFLKDVLNRKNKPVEYARFATTRHDTFKASLLRNETKGPFAPRFVIQRLGKEVS